MSKYESFKKFLMVSAKDSLRMSFGEIEQVLGFPLPASKQYQAWWSNNPTNNVMTRAWLDAGYRTSNVDVEGERITFIKVSSAEGAARKGSSASSTPNGPAKGSPWGVWANSVKLVSDFDYTAPADPEWKKVYED